ncbi:hypothetical protein [Paenibacillus terreus]
MPLRSWQRVDFPLPLAPTMAVCSPPVIDSVTSLKAGAFSPL